MGRSPLPTKEGIPCLKQRSQLRKNQPKKNPQNPRGAGTPREQGKYEATGTYNPKAAKNLESYEAVCKILPASLEEITQSLPEHSDFVGYLIRRGAIAPK